MEHEPMDASEIGVVLIFLVLPWLAMLTIIATLIFGD